MCDECDALCSKVAGDAISSMSSEIKIKRSGVSGVDVCCPSNFFHKSQKLFDSFSDTDTNFNLIPTSSSSFMTVASAASSIEGGSEPSWGKDEWCVRENDNRAQLVGWGV